MSDERNWADDLVEAIGIFRRYHTGPCAPLACEHDTLHVAVDPRSMAPGDVERLEVLGFLAVDGTGFHSFRFGSC